MLRLVGTWQVTAVGGSDVPPDSPHAPWLTFDGDGQVYGMSGVNRVRGTFAVDADTVTFGPMASTMMAGPDDATRVESSLLRALAQPLTLATPERSTPAAAPAAPSDVPAPDGPAPSSNAPAPDEPAPSSDASAPDQPDPSSAAPAPDRPAEADAPVHEEAVSPLGRLTLVAPDGDRVELVRTIAPA